VEALRKLKDFNDQLSNEKKLKNQISYLQQFQSIEVAKLFLQQD
jgi:hypothetical protein